MQILLLILMPIFTLISIFILQQILVRILLWLLVLIHKQILGSDMDNLLSILVLYYYST